MPSVQQIWERYLSDGGGANATAFGVWLIQHQPELANTRTDLPAGPSANAPAPQSFQTLDKATRSAILVGRLDRFLHFLTKPVLKSSGLTTDEFIVLATLLYMPQIAKTQLLKQCLIEIPTGSELLKRMKQSGLILEKQHPDDGRSCMISISAKGRQLLFATFAHLEQVEDALSVLSEDEKSILLDLLDRLDKHHSKRHEIRQVSELMRGS